MQTSAYYLVRASFDDTIPVDNVSVLVDYFNVENCENDENLNIIFRVYQGLIKFKGINEDLLHKCFLQKRLDELIHKKNKYSPTGYYEQFVKKHIVIGNTNMLPKKERKLEILDDDHCPYCKSIGYITQEKSVNLDCPRCLQLMCKDCLIEDDDEIAVHQKCKTV